MFFILFECLPFFAQTMKDSHCVEMFAKFIEWPNQYDNNSEKFTICVNSSQEFFNTFSKELDGKQIKSKPIKLILLNTNQILPKCNILFIDHNNSALIDSSIYEQAKANSSLTITNSVTTNCSCIIQFEDGFTPIIFYINQTCATQSKLKISHLLLMQAQRVTSQKP